MENVSLGRTTALGRMIGKPFLIGLAGLMLSAASSNAQTPRQGTFVVGAYAGPVLQVGVGDEALIQNRFGIGGELGLARGGGDTWATFFLNGSLHFPKPGTKNGLVPFVSGGYTAFFRGSRGITALNVGGGVTYWFNDRKGLLVGFRDVLSQPLGTNHYWAARIGISFR